MLQHKRSEWSWGGNSGRIGGHNSSSVPDGGAVDCSYYKMDSFGRWEAELCLDLVCVWRASLWLLWWEYIRRQMEEGARMHHGSHLRGSWAIQNSGVRNGGGKWWSRFEATDHLAFKGFVKRLDIESKRTNSEVLSLGNKGTRGHLLRWNRIQE